MRLLLAILILTALGQPAFALEHKDQEQDQFCYKKYGQAFNVDPDVLEAISWVESRHNPTAINTNSETSIDYGHMQINSYWIDQLLGEQYSSLDDPCFCTAIGAYILNGCINSYGLNQDALSCYNSGKSLDLLGAETRKRVEKYIALVHKKYEEIKQTSNVRN